MLHLYLSFLEYLRKPSCRKLTKREKNQRKYPTIPLLSSSPRPITSSELYAEDADNPPEELLYEVKEPPKRGRLAMRDDINRNVFRFTQVRRGGRAGSAFCFGRKDQQSRQKGVGFIIIIIIIIIII